MVTGQDVFPSALLALVGRQGRRGRVGKCAYKRFRGSEAVHYSNTYAISDTGPPPNTVSTCRTVIIRARVCVCTVHRDRVAKRSYSFKKLLTCERHTTINRKSTRLETCPSFPSSEDDRHTDRAIKLPARMTVGMGIILKEYENVRCCDTRDVAQDTGFRLLDAFTGKLRFFLDFNGVPRDQYSKYRN